MTQKDRIAIAIGDPNGIGPEIAVRAASALAGSTVEPVLVGDSFVVREYAQRFAPGLPILAPDDERPGLRLYPVDALPLDEFRPGELSAAAGRATVAYATAAVQLAQASKVRAVVGCPHSETAIHKAGIAFSGYPSLVARLTGKPEHRVFMLLAAGGLRIAHVTLHESVASALRRISTDLVLDAGLAAVRACHALGVPSPSLGVFGINPHAGENGLFGDEDARITAPAVARLRELGVNATGPLGADLLLSQRKHDVYLAMFHDQGHIPIKLLSPLRASALAIGTEIVFSSVGHGSAFDIAGKGVADPTSVIETVQLLHSGWSGRAQ